jgi:hypothetical protein
LNGFLIAEGFHGAEAGTFGVTTMSGGLAEFLQRKRARSWPTGVKLNPAC